MSAADIPDEWVEKAARALHHLSPEKGCASWPCDYANRYRLRARTALAAVADDIRKDAWGEGWKAGIEDAQGRTRGLHGNPYRASKRAHAEEVGK